MLIDARQIRESPATAVCVIGAGPAGLALATHLLRRGIDTTVLVGGGEDPDAEQQQLARVVSTGIRTDDTLRANVRALGGSSRVWGGYCLQLTPEDFEPRPWIPHSGWPIRLTDVEPWYAKAAAFVAGEEERPEDWSFDPARHALAPLLRSSIVHNAVTYIRPVRFGMRHLEELRGGKGRVLLNASAVELETDAAATRVTAVRCRTLAGNTFGVRARLVVVAAGGVQNPRILLASRSTNPAGLGNAHDRVGRYFMQHPEYRHGSLVTNDFPSLRRLEPGAKAPRISLPTAFTRAHQERHSLPSCHFLLERADYYSLGADESAWSRLRRKLSRWKRVHGRSAAEQALHEWMSWMHRGDSSAAETSVVKILLRPEQCPDPDSRISLSDESDALGMPVARMEWRLSEQDWEHADRCLSWFGCAIGGEDIGRVRYARGAAREAARTFLHGGFHYYGTTRMSESPRSGVVDRDCKVHGIDNLYAAGSSVFPTTGYANPTFTIIALALRLAEHLERRAATAP